MNLVLPKSLQNLIQELKKLPGVGPKSAERLAFHLLRTHRPNVQALGEAVLKLNDGVLQCAECFNVSEKSPCNICENPQRDRHVICVVEEATDALAIENTHEYHGLYHVLHGRISPLNKVAPKDLQIDSLAKRIMKLSDLTMAGFSKEDKESGRPLTTMVRESAEVRVREPAIRATERGPELYKKEIILAMNPDMEGETTALYLAKLLKPLGVKITRIARGIPVGSDLEYADQVTLTRAMEGRQLFE